MAEELNYRELWAEGEIEAGTLLNAIDDLRAQLPSQGGEAVEVVGWRVEFPLNNGAKVYDQRQEWAYQEYGDVSYHVDELMAVDQHYRILAAQRTKTCIALKERNDAKAVAQHQRILAAATHPADQVVEPGAAQEIQWLEQWLLLAAEPIGQECCGQAYLECCGNAEPVYRTADEIAVAMNARGEELRALLGTDPQ